MKKRPSDNTIKIGRILFWLILSWSLYYNFFYQTTPNTLDPNFFWQDIAKENLKYIQYWFIAIWIIPIFMWVTNICLLKKKYMRYIQVFFWIVLFYISSQIEDTAYLDVDVLIWFMWVLPLIAWITGKCITSNCMKYMEKITKIRV